MRIQVWIVSLWSSLAYTNRALYRTHPELDFSQVDTGHVILHTYWASCGTNSLLFVVSGDLPSNLEKDS